MTIFIGAGSSHWGTTTSPGQTHQFEKFAVKQKNQQMKNNFFSEEESQTTPMPGNFCFETEAILTMSGFLVAR